MMRTDCSMLRRKSILILYSLILLTIFYLNSLPKTFAIIPNAHPNELHMTSSVSANPNAQQYCSTSTLILMQHPVTKQYIHLCRSFFAHLNIYGSASPSGKNRTTFINKVLDASLLYDIVVNV